METLASVFGSRVRALRESRRWTQEQLGKAAGIGAKHIGVIERGEKTSSFEAVERIAKAFGVQYFELFVPHQRRTAALEKEINALVNDPRRIDVAKFEEFLQGLRMIVRKLDRRQKA